MVSSTLVIVALGAFPLALATPYNYYPAGNATATYAPAPTASGSLSATQTVAVGQNGLTFTPDTIYANVGDEITFQFFPKNHSVVQADFKNPCNPSENGIFSGFIPSTSGPANQTFTVTVENEKPIWLYCAALKPMPHCAAGMVAVINPPASGPNTLDAFRTLAMTTNTSTAPVTPAGGQVESTPPNRTSSSIPAEFNGAASMPGVSGAVVGVMIAVFATFM